MDLYICIIHNYICIIYTPVLPMCTKCPKFYKYSLSITHGICSQKQYTYTWRKDFPVLEEIQRTNYKIVLIVGHHFILFLRLVKLALFPHWVLTSTSGSFCFFVSGFLFSIVSTCLLILSRRAQDSGWPLRSGQVHSGGGREGGRDGRGTEGVTHYVHWTGGTSLPP